MDTNALAHLRFVWTLLGMLGASALAILAFTVSVDPYEAFGMLRARGYNARKIDSGNDRLVKAGAIRYRLYRSLILGTSQAQFGLDPAHGALGNLPAPTYNAGLLRGSPYQLRRYLQGANREGQVKKALLLVDLLMFGARNADEREAMGFVENRLAVDANGAPQPHAWLLETGDLAFSWSAIRHSASTVWKQDRPEEEWIFPDGLQNPRTVEAELLGKRGPRHAFESAERRYGLWFDGFTLSKASGAATKNRDAASDFADLVTYARANGIELTIAIAPTHARYTQMLWALNLGSAIDDLKRRLVSSLEAEGQNAGATPFELWDFSAAHPLTTEDVPQAVGPNVRMDRYYDSAHFTPKLGDILLGRIAGETPEGAEDFGVRLTSGNIDSELERSRRLHAAYAQEHAAEVAKVREHAKPAPRAGRKKSRPVPSIR